MNVMRQASSASAWDDLGQESFSNLSAERQVAGVNATEQLLLAVLLRSPTKTAMTEPMAEYPTASTSTAPLLDIPVVPILYHLATSAHQASHHHLHQIYVPRNVSPAKAEAIELNTPFGPIPFQHDSQARRKALGFLLLALDLLRLGLNRKELSESERVAFGLEFGVVGMKVLDASRLTGKGKAVSVEDPEKLRSDVAETLSQSVSPLLGQFQGTC